jgi:thymidylate kinase
MLIALDGVYSVGKSTTIELLRDRLAGRAAGPVTVSDWNSSGLVGDLIPQWKRGGELGGQSLLLAEALDLAHRLERTVNACLAAGGTVIADRYVLSGMARAIIRGIDADLAANTFAFAPKETLLVLVDCPSPVTLDRRKALGKVLDGYHSGRDFRRTGHGVENDFVAYQDEMRELYRTLATGRGPRVEVNSAILTPDECVEQIMSALRDASGPTAAVEPLVASRSPAP